MPLTVAGLTAAIIAEQDARSPVGDTEAGASGAQIRAESAAALAEAIVKYLVANATVIGACPSGGGPLTAGRIT